MDVVEQTARRLNLGCGHNPIEGYENLDLIDGTDCTKLDQVPDGSCSEIRASHLLEHFRFSEVQDIVNHWSDKLEYGGVLKIAVPDFRKIAEHYVTGEKRDNKLFFYLMGGQTNDDDFHKCVFDHVQLRHVFRNAGFGDVEFWDHLEEPDTARNPITLAMMGRKVRQANQRDLVIPKTVCLLSQPRVGFNDNTRTTAEICAVRGIRCIDFMGAYWHQCLDRLMIQATEEHNAEYILTVDFDSVYTGDMLDRLMATMILNPDVDALFPWQMKRNADKVMVWREDADSENHGDKFRDFTDEEKLAELVKVDTGHFGLTILKAEALKRVQPPWFEEKPAKDGHYGAGRIDPDVGFWLKWKASGNNLYLANHLSLGHYQHVISWVGDKLQPIHQYASDYAAHGVPAKIRWW